MFPQFVKNDNFPRFIIDEKNVRTTFFEKNGIFTVKSQNFRMFLSSNAKYLYVAVTPNHCIKIAIVDDVVNMTLSGVKNANHIMSNFSNFVYSPLLYLVLFIHNLYEDKYTNLMWYLRKTLPNKPFTTHRIFHDDPFSELSFTNRYALNECCKMYKSVMNGDSRFPREIYDLKPWNITNLEDYRKYNDVKNRAYSADLNNRVLVESGNVNSSFDNIYVENTYILFEYAIMYNRVDIATMLYIEDMLNIEMLLKIVKNWPHNDVVKFVLSLEN